MSISDGDVAALVAVRRDQPVPAPRRQNDRPVFQRGVCGALRIFPTAAVSGAVGIGAVLAVLFKCVRPQK